MADVLDNSLTKGTGDFLSHKAGPLPVWGWLIVAGGTAFVVRRYMNRATAAADESASDGTNVGGTGGNTTDGTYAYPGASYGNPGYSSGPLTDGTGTAPEDTSPTDMIDWQAQAVRAIVDKGIANAYTASEAVRKYTTSQPLSAAEQAMINEAIAMIGVPPTGIPDAPEPVPATPTSPTKPVTILRNVQSTITLTPRAIPTSKGQTLVYDVRWLEKPTNKGVTGTLTTWTYYPATGWTKKGAIRVVNGVAQSMKLQYSTAGKRGFRVSTSDGDTVHIPTKSNDLMFNVK